MCMMIAPEAPQAGALAPARPFTSLHTTMHTFIHTTFMGAAERSQKLVRRAKIAQEISETGGIIEIRSVGRSRRHAARTMSRAMRKKSSYRKIKILVTAVAD